MFPRSEEYSDIIESEDVLDKESKDRDILKLQLSILRGHVLSGCIFHLQVLVHLIC